MEHTIEELMAQCKSLYAKVVHPSKNALTHLVICDGGVEVVSGGYGVASESINTGIGSTPRIALLDLRRKLIEIGKKQVGQAEELQAFLVGIGD